MFFIMFVSRSNGTTLLKLNKNFLYEKTENRKVRSVESTILGADWNHLFFVNCLGRGKGKFFQLYFGILS